MHAGTSDPFGLYWSCTDFKELHRLFKVPYEELMHILYVLSKEMNLSYNDMNNMSFFEILSILDVYKENMEQQRKANDKENKRMEKQMQSMQKNYNTNYNQNNNYNSI